MPKQDQANNIKDLQGELARSRASFDSFFASDEGREACAGSYSNIVRVKKMSFDVFGRLLAKEIPDNVGDRHQWLIKQRLFVQPYGSDRKLRPVLGAKIVTTTRDRLPYIYTTQRWNLLRKRERVLLLFFHCDISSPDVAITGADILHTWGECRKGLLSSLFPNPVPWIGVADGKCIGGKYGDAAMWFEAESVRFDREASAFIFQAKWAGDLDWSDEGLPKVLLGKRPK